MTTRRHFLTSTLSALAGLSLAPTPIFARQTLTSPAADSWATASLADLGFDPNLESNLVDALPNYPAATGVVVVRRGVLALETYTGNHDADTLVNARSVTKSVTSILVGIALERGDLRSIDITVGEAMPNRIPSNADPLAFDLSMRNLLTMTSGLWWSGSDDWSMLLAADDWVRNTLNQPIVADPGVQFVYNTGGSHLIGVMLSEIVGQPLEDYADEHLFGPLGIVRGEWMRSPQGEVNGGSGLELLPRDMAKLGHLLGTGGQWNQNQLVQAAYAQSATTRQSDGEAVTGGSIGVPYGFQWWITNATGYDAFFALGYGGNYIYVVPDLELVVVVAAGFDDGGSPILTSHRPISEQIVIPAIVN